MKLFKIKPNHLDKFNIKKDLKSEWEWIDSIIILAESLYDARVLCSNDDVIIRKLINPSTCLDKRFFTCEEIDTSKQTIVYIDHTDY